MNIEVINEYKACKKSGEPREKFLERIAKIEGVYVPSFYDVEYNEDQTVKSVTPNRECANPHPRKRIIRDMNKVEYPERFIVPYIDTVHDRIVLEIFRGCTRGCRFCQAGMIYRPIREKNFARLKEILEKLIKTTGPYIDTVHDRIVLEIFRGCTRGCRFCQAGMIYRPIREKNFARLKEILEKLIKTTGYDEISLVSLSTSDYSQLAELTDYLVEEYATKNVGISLPSLRLDNFSMEIANKIQKVRKSGLTFAPEAGSQRLRDVINKGITEEDLTRASRQAFEMGWNNIKLYFMSYKQRYNRRRFN